MAGRYFRTTDDSKLQQLTAATLSSQENWIEYEPIVFY